MNPLWKAVSVAEKAWHKRPCRVWVNERKIDEPKQKANNGNWHHKSWLSSWHDINLLLSCDEHIWSHSVQLFIESHITLTADHSI